MNFGSAIDVLGGLVDLGGPVVALLLAMSVVALAVVIWKLAVFAQARVGRHNQLAVALDAWDAGEDSTALACCRKSRSHFAPVLADVFLFLSDQPANDGFQDRITTSLASRLANLERGFKLLDNISQIAPLLGLFGTVLGMIDAFQALQDAGASVDPSILAGGIWVALLTTAVGLGVAMPTSLLLSWLENRVHRERTFADRLVARAFYPHAEGDTMASAAFKGNSSNVAAT